MGRTIIGSISISGVWSNFHENVRDLAAKATAIVTSQRNRSEEVVTNYTMGLDTKANLRSALNPDEIVWHHLQVASSIFISGARESLWIDEDNVCNGTKLQVAILELCRFGFTCTARHLAFDIWIKVGVPPCMVVPTVRIEGVDILKNQHGPRGFAVCDM